MAVEQLYKGIELATAVSFCFWSLILDLYVFEADRNTFSEIILAPCEGSARLSVVQPCCGFKERFEMQAASV